MLENPLHKKEEISNIKMKIEKDANLYSKTSRFGYFSIPYSTCIGDGYYAFKSKFPSRDNNNKVKLQPKNIKVSVLKSGNNPDVLFSNPYYQNDKILKCNKIFAKNQAKLYLNKLSKLNKQNVVYPFKPGGPQEKKDYFSKNKYINKKTLYKEKEKNYSINKENRKVIIEKKNIQTSVPKKGGPGYKDITFSYPSSTGIKFKKIYNNKMKQKNKNNEAGHMFVFKPANKVLNDNFYSDRMQYGLPNTMEENMISDYKRAKTAGKKKFINETKDFYAKHMFQFRPASNTKKGENGFFSKSYGIPFTPYIANKRPITSKEKFNINAFK